MLRGSHQLRRGRGGGLSASVRGADSQEPKSQGLQGNQPHSMQGRVKVASPALSVVLISGRLSVSGAKGTSPTACRAESRWPLSVVLIPGSLSVNVAKGISPTACRAE